MDAIRLAVAEHADFDLDPVEELLHEHLVVVAECQRTASASSPSSWAFEIPTDEPSRAGLTNTGNPNGFSTGSSPARSAMCRATGKPAVAQHLLEEVLVHAESRSRDAGADVRDTGELEQSLDGAVLPERAVEDRQHDVDGAESGRGVRRGDGQRLRDRAVPPVPSSQRPSRPIATVTTS